MVAYPFHAFLLNFSNEFSSYLIVHVYTLAGLLLESTLDIPTEKQEGIKRSSTGLTEVMDAIPLGDDQQVEIRKGGEGNYKSYIIWS